MAANTKGKIIIGIGLLLVAGGAAYVISGVVKKRRVSKKIYDQLNDTTLQGAGKNVSADEAHKFTLALDPNFWKRTTGTPLPTKPIHDKIARERARAIHANIGIYDNEDKIMTEIKKNTTQGQLSQVAYQYSAIGYGNLGDSLQSGLSGGWFEADRLKELNAYINSLPY